jgi:hypothetical protein
MRIEESYKSMAALEHYAIEAATTTFREKLMPMNGSLYDQRLYRLLHRAITTGAATILSPRATTQPSS